MNNIYKNFSWRLLLATASIFMLANAQGSTSKKVYVMELNNSGFYTQENLLPDTKLLVYTTKNNPNKKVLMYTAKNTKAINSITPNKQVLSQIKKSANSISSKYRILFKFNSYKISASAKIKLMSIINKVNKITASKSSLKIVLIGRADYIGTKIYNHELSKKRALSVKNYITNNSKINSKIIFYYSYGESRPIKSIKDRAINRSVTIDLLNTGAE